MRIKLNKGQKWMLLFTLLYIVSFSVYYLSIRNYEFLWYIGVILFFFVLILATISKSEFDNIILGGLSVWGLMHLAGGGFIIGGEVLYNFKIFHIADVAGSTILKFDQVVHAFGFAVATLVVFHLLHPYLNERTNGKVLFPIVVMAGAGLGALNEVVEFIAVISFPNTNVGGYTNTALDIIFNFFGAIGAVIFIKIINYKNYKKYEQRI